VRRTGGKDENSRYHPRLSLADIERMELETVNAALGFGHEIAPAPRRNERVFWRRFPDVIGASKGREANYIYVIYNRSGVVHGYPVGEDELRRAGVEL
jgi:hypothetical protein